MADTKTKTTIQPTIAELRAKRRELNQKVYPKEANHRTISLTQETIDELTAIVRKGNFQYVARGRLGISVGTFNSWKARGRKHLQEFEAGTLDLMTIQAKLVVAIDKAENEAHATLLQDVLDSDNTKVKMDFLRRRYGKLYSMNPNAHDDDTGEDVKVDPLVLLADKLKHFIVED